MKGQSLNQQGIRIKAKKQEYLRVKILDENSYDPQEFITYLNQKLKINSNIDDCSLEELQNVVEMFIKFKNQTIVQNRSNSALYFAEESSFTQNSSDLNEGVLQKKKKNSTKNKVFLLNNSEGNFFEEEFEVIKKCIKIEQKHLNIQMAKVICEVHSQLPERKYTGGIFGMGSSSFLEFKVQTYGMNWLVWRRYSDFIWLRAMLKKYYPSQIIPPIPNKKASKRTAKHIEKRMRILTYFLNEILKMPDLFCSKYVEGFLSMKQNSKFETLKKEAENKQIFQSIMSTETQAGSVRIWLDEDSIKYDKQLKDFVKNTQVLYKEITRNGKKLQSHLIDQVNTLFELGNQFGQLYQQSKQFSSTVRTKPLTNFQEVSLKLNNMMIQWGSMLKNQISLFQTNFNIFFKYARQSYMGYHELFKKEEKLLEEYLEVKTELDKKKQKIFVLYDSSKWEINKKQVQYIPKESVLNRSEAFKIMLPKQSIQYENIKLDYFFSVSRLHENSQAHFERTIESFYENFKEFAIKNKVNNQQLGGMWNQMSLNFASRKLSEDGMNKLERKTMSKILNNDEVNSGAED